MRKTKKLNILAIGPHPDDIEFGCGGTLIRMVKAGYGVHMLVLTKGEAGGRARVRQMEQQRAARFIGVRKVFFGDFKDTHIPSDKTVVSVIEKTLQRTKADFIFVNYKEDTHQDHRVIAENTIAASRYVKGVFFYEVPTSQGFEPSIFVDIADALKDKLRLLALHASQVSKTGVNNLSILENAKSCANFRGFQARVKYAEGFKPLRFLMNL